MEPMLAATPFGRRRLSPAMRAARRAAETLKPGAAAHKWTLLHDLTAARARFGLADRALAVLAALLSVHPDTALAAGPDLVVFPSNRDLCRRAHGIAEATLRRHLAALVEAGLILRRDSPNGKRYARRDAAGALDQAFGFDLAPLVARADEIAAAAAEIAAEARRLALKRSEVSLHRRDLLKTLDLLAEAAEAGRGPSEAVAGLAAASRPLMRPQTRRLDAVALETLCAALKELRRSAEKLLMDLEKTGESGGTAASFERHLSDSNTDAPDLEPFAKETETKPSPFAPDDTERGTEEHKKARGTDPAGPAGQAEPPPLPLVLKACPQVADYAPDGIRSWPDLLATADFLRPMLGVSPSAWEEAKAVMGGPVAAATLAAILERAETIRSPGGYLRTLTEKRRAGQFSVGPILMALIGTRARGQAAAKARAG